MQAAVGLVATVALMGCAQPAEIGEPCDTSWGNGLGCRPDPSVCVEGAFCDRGTCAARPTECDMEGPAVCACDGNIYVNACWANLNGVTTVRSPGITPTTGLPICGGCLHDGCPNGGYCSTGLREGFFCCPTGSIC